jgi:putative transposase
VTWAIDNKGYSQRRACGLVGMEPRVYRYRPSRPDDAALRKRLRELAAERRRFGYRRLHLLLKREGVAVNWKKLYRLYREERLTCASEAAASGHWAPERRWQSRRM